MHVSQDLPDEGLAHGDALLCNWCAGQGCHGVSLLQSYVIIQGGLLLSLLLVACAQKLLPLSQSITG